MTATDVEKLAWKLDGKPQQILYDGKQPGFGVRVFPSGKKSFVLRYRTKDGRTRIHTIGAWPAFTVKQARDVAEAELVRIRAGADPVEERRQQRSEPTLDDIATEYIEKNKARLRPKTVAQYEALRRHFRGLRQKPVTLITVRDASRMHARLHTTPMVANHALAFLSTVLHWAEGQQYRPVNSNPCTAVKRYAQRGRERFLSVAETASLGEALRKALDEGLPAPPTLKRKPGDAKKQKHRPKLADAPIPANPYAIAVIRFLLLSGWRKSEAQTLRWEDIDFERRSATLRQTKTGRSHRPLGAPALALLSELGRVEGNPYVFPGEKSGEPIKDIKRVWGAVRHAAGLGAFRLHDLRHSVASFSVASGQSLFITGALLGHSRPTTTARYAHLADDVRHAAADSVSEIIAAAMNSTKGKDNVVQIDTRKPKRARKAGE